MENIPGCILIGYLTAVNLIGFVAMGMDKHRAKKRKWRIPEARLFLFAAIGGSLGSWIGMYVFRHKTRHWYFVVGMPVILALQIALGVFIKTTVL
ncbi:MAG: DUF1294 domain-containing protein [Lachnospiraceae bacterium]|nr:DUF1294 domain-containing protein [Lachnospiraceae bacterium]